MLFRSDGFLHKVEDLVIYDDVITHNGHSTKISAVTKSKPSIYNGNGDAISITSWLGEPIILTPNHPVFTQRGWVKAGELQKSDLLSMPVRKINDEIKSVRLPMTSERKQGGGKKFSGNHDMILTKEVGFALGYYLAEGSLHYSKNGPANEITLTRHNDESEFADRAITALIPYISSHSRKQKVGTLTTHEHIYSTALARWIATELGVKDKKRIPDWFFNCGEDFIIGVLEGLLSGDGSKTNEKSGKYELASIRLTTVSSSIATQMRDIAASLGLGWGAINVREQGEYYGRNCKKTYVVRWYDWHW